MGSCFTALCQGRPWSYLRSTGCHRQPGGPRDVNRRIHIPVQRYPASLALPDADMQRLRSVLHPADRAHLAGGLEPANPVKLSAVQPGLVLQHRHEAGPSGVMNGLGLAGAGESSHCQVFHRDHLVLADQGSGQLVVEISPGIGDPRMSTSDLDPGLVPVPAASLLARQVALGSPEFLLRPAQEMRRSDLRPSDRTAKCASPRSMPSTGCVSGRAPGSVSTTKLVDVPAGRILVKVTLDGPDGKGRDQRTCTSPTFGRRSFPLGSTRKRALEVNRSPVGDPCGTGPGRRDFRPVACAADGGEEIAIGGVRSTSACCSTTEDTSVSQARSRVFIAVSRADNSASLMYGSPAANASWRARSPSLNTTRAHPNARASATCWPSV